MDKQPTCPDCGLQMERGFVPDMWGIATQSNWHPGSVKELRTLIGCLKLDDNLIMKITAYRCPECGQLKQYATRET